MTLLPEIKNTSYRLWALPIFRALSTLGGEAAPIKIEEAIRKLPTYPFSELQWARAIKGKYVRWAGSDLKKLGLLAGTGEWILTDLGRAYLDAHAKDEIQWPKVMPLDAKLAGQVLAPLETVDVTDFAGYEIPALRALARGPSAKQPLVKRIGDDLRDVLLPGDHRTMNGGNSVYDYRVSWCLSNLKKAGEARNPTTGTWEITEAGRARLDRELAGWQIAPFQDSKAKVRAEWVEGSSPDAQPKHASLPPKPIWPTPAWKALGPRFEDVILEGFLDRVRPDLGPTPELEGSLARNVIFYGPPGTGKTFVAKAIAEALTGELEPDGDGPWTIVQFHPSYSYEDFVQGLRPDLSQPQLRYEVRKGPFFQLCAAAEKEPDKFYVLVIDEINRGDPARIFGELLYALEYRGEAVELALGGQLRVPPNLIVVGTMNSVDRSVALVDYALRRRFAFVRIDPDADAIRQTRGDPDGGELAARTLERFNEWIEGRLDRDHTLGHSFFMNRATELLDGAALARIWRNDVLPLLEEYFYGDAKALADAEKAWRSASAEQVLDASASEPELDDTSP